MEIKAWSLVQAGFERMALERSTVVGVLLTLAVLATIAIALALIKRSKRNTDYSPGNDQFGLSAPMSQHHISVLRYLNNAFPEGMVLFRPSLARFMAVRKTNQRRAAQRHLMQTTVDFLVCDEDGKPVVAFEVDVFRNAKDPDAQRKVAEKSRLLLSTGIRVIRLKGALGNLPSASELRMRLYEAQRLAGTLPEQGLGTASTFAHTGTAPSSFGHTELNLTMAQEASAWRQLPNSDASTWSLVAKRS